LVYYEKDQSLYFSLPDTGILQKLDLGSGKISTVLKGNSLLPHPQALCVAGGKFYVADRDLPDVYEFTPHSGRALNQIAQSPASIIGLAGSGKSLYAYFNNPDCPVYRFFPNQGPLAFPSALNYSVSLPITELSPSYSSPRALIPAFQTSADLRQVGFIFNPRSDDRFYITNPTLSFIAAIRDNTTSATPLDPSYDLMDVGFHTVNNPYTKPPGTFRILLLGRSFIDDNADDYFFYQPQKARGEVWTEMKSVAKRLERDLNTEAALEDYPSNFEVLEKSCRVFNLLTESCWDVPKNCADDDIDLVLIMQDDDELWRTYQNMFTRPVDSDGVPVRKMDPEFLVKPIKDRFPPGIQRDFLQYVVSKKMVNMASDTNWIFNPDSYDSVAWDLFIRVISRPLKILKNKMDGMKTSEGKVPQLVLCYFPVCDRVFTDQKKKSFWRDICRNEGVTFLDLCDDFSVVGMSYHPFAITHFTEGGMDLWARILAHELSRNNLIPTNKSGAGLNPSK
jgi:hypothetical protein